MADAKTLLQKYISDMLSLEEHIFEAIEKQAKGNRDDSEASSKFAKYAQTVKRHQEALRARLNQIGTPINQPIKEGVASMLGFAAGLIDKIRSEEVSKDLRDDFTALNLSVISYQMLHTTALALGDTETANLAAANVKDNAKFVMEIQRLIPRVVVRDLQNNHPEVRDTLVKGAEDQTHKLIEEIWK